MYFTPGINKRKWQSILIPAIALTVCGIFGIQHYIQFNIIRFPFLLFITLTIFTFAIWEANLFIYRKLDSQIPFFVNPQKRVAKQLVYGFLVTVLAFSILYALMALLISSPIQLSVFLKFLFIACVISLTINVLYVYQYLQKSIYYREVIKTENLNEKIRQLLAEKRTYEHETTTINSTKNTTAAIKSILIEAGNKTLHMRFEEIAYFMSGEGVVVLIKTDGQKLTTNYNSFSLINNRLPTNLFFQLNRQVITHLQSIRSVTDDINRKLIVQISPGQKSLNKESVTVSRYRNAEFKQWFSRQLSSD